MPLSLDGTTGISASGNITAAYLFGNASGLSGISSNKIFNGTSEANIGTSGGNANVSIGGTANVAVFTTSGLTVTGLTATGNSTLGNLTITGSRTIDVGNNRISNLAEPSAGTDAATKDYVDSVSSSGFTIEDDTANTTVVSGGDTLELFGTANEVEVAVTATDRVTFGLPANVSISNTLSATGNVTGGNLLTSGQLSASGNVTGATINTNTVRGTSLALISTGDLVLSATGNINANNDNINNLAAPQQANDAATKQYVDDVAQGLNVHDAAKAATTTDLATTTGGTITYNNGTSGVGATLTTTGSFNLIDSANVQTAGTRILVKNEANAVFNGVYVWSNATVITRATDFDSVPEVEAGDFIFVTAGNTFGNCGFVQTSSPTGIGTAGNTISFTQFSGSGAYSAGTGLTLTGTTFSVNASQTQITSVGTLSTLSVSGNVTGGNVLTGGAVSATGNVTGSYILGNGSQLSGIITSVANINNGTTILEVVSSGGNIRANVGGTANVAVLATTGLYVTGVVSASGNVSAGNITTGGGSGGNLTGANVISANTITASSTMSATGNVTGGNLISGALVSATTVSASGNVAAGNLTTSGQVSATGNITGGNLITGGGTGGNITGANVITATTLSSTGNTVAGNLTTAGLISATGNITGGNVLGGANVNATTHTGTTVSVTGNVTGGNILTAGVVSATGNITGSFILGNGSALTGMYGNANVVANLAALSSNPVSTTGNVTAGNLLTAGLVSSTGNITTAANIVTGGGNGGNISGANVIFCTTLSATGNINGANVITGNGTGGNITGANVMSANTLSIGNILNSNANGVGNIGNSTTYFNTVFAKATSAQYADLAENYTADQAYPPGTVVIFGGGAEVTQSIASDDHRVAGVVSTNPSHLMNAGLTGDHVVALALQGRVPCRVTGSVARGDLLVSAAEGRAKANNQARAGTIIGKALQDSAGADGVIEIAVGRD